MLGEIHHTLREVTGKLWGRLPGWGAGRRQHLLLGGPCRLPAHLPAAPALLPLPSALTLCSLLLCS
jgi:hypothetical protein